MTHSDIRTFKHSGIFIALAITVFCAPAAEASASRTPSDYVQDGLVAMFDGICNTGADSPHDGETTVWKDLSGKSSDATISLRGTSGWLDGSFLRTGPASGSVGYGTTTYLEYTLPQSFVDVLNAGGACTIEFLCRFIANSAGPGALFALGGKSTMTYFHLGANGKTLNYFGYAVELGALSSTKTNTVTTVFDGGRTFSRYLDGELAVSLLADRVQHRARNATSATVGAFTAGAGQWGSSVDVYAIRVYERALTAKEIMKNARTDDERFFGSNETWVVETKGAFGDPVPATGLSRVAPGTVCEVATDMIEISEGERMVLTGWSWTPDGGTPVSGTGTECTPGVSADGTVEWHWKRQFKIAATATEGLGGVSGSGWYDEGTSVTLALTPQDGAVLLGWTGDLEESTDRLAQTITVAADSARTLTASLATLSSSQPTTRTFAKTGESGTFNWNDPSIWGGEVPQAGDEIVINGDADNIPVIVVDTPLPVFKSVSVRYAKISFAGWNVPLRTTGDVTLSTFSTLTHAPMSADGSGDPSRVWVVCENFNVVYSGSMVNADGMGWQGVTGGAGTVPDGVGGSHGGSSGGTYGGLGGVGADGFSSIAPFGSLEHPRDLGIAGSTATGNASTGGPGGGAVLIQARGTVTVAKGNVISAEGKAGSGGNWLGGGSGGSIEIECRTIEGAGTIRAGGGAGGNGWGASGGGGRIAIHCDAAAQDALGYSALTFLVRPGVGWNGAYCYGGNCTYAEHGTLYLSAKSLLNTNVNVSAQVYLPVPKLEVDGLVIPDKRRVEFPQDGFHLDVAGDVTLNGASGLVLGGEKIGYFTDSYGDDYAPRGSRRFGGVKPVKATIGGNLTMSGAKTEIVLYPVSSGDALDADGNPAGALLQVGRTLVMKSGARIYPLSCGTNGISCAIRTRQLDMRAGSVFYAKARGFFGGCANNYVQLPGQTIFGYTGASWFPLSNTAGASHGGLGGGVTDERALYGDAQHPVLPGAGSNVPNTQFNGTGGHGGGLIHIEVEKSAAVNGTFNVQALVGTGGNAGHACSAAAGGIYLKTRNLMIGEDARFLANGCNANAHTGSGGGGRVAIWRVYDDEGCVDYDTFTNTVCTVAGGDNGSIHSPAGKPGTIVFGQLPKPGLLLIVR